MYWWEMRYGVYNFHTVIFFTDDIQEAKNYVAKFGGFYMDLTTKERYYE